jgi:TolB-like protein/DNA-binding CsgD family transcriptional regulator/Flp pilus assembly protein TadD
MSDLPTPELLTPRQLEVLELMARGLTNREIAGVLEISAATVKVHVSAIIKALDVSNRTEAAMALRELGDHVARAAEGDAPGVPGFGDRPTLLVLPFDDLSPDDDQGFFVDGLVEDLTTSLAAWRWFPVIARNTAFALRGRPIVVTEVARELGARYVIEGSARRAGDKVRIHVQVIDGESGAHVYARKVDRTVADVFEAQDEIVEAIVGTLEPTLLRVEGLRALRRPVGGLGTWEHFQRALVHVNEQMPDSVDRAIEHLDAAIAAEPGFAPAHALRGIAGFSRGLLHLGATHWRETSDEEMRTAHARAAACFAESVAAGRRATEYDPLDPTAWLALGSGLALTGQLDAGRAALERAVELGPSSAMACWSLGALLLRTPRLGEARRLFERARTLSPRDPLLHHFEGGIATVHFTEGEDEEALAWARRSFEHEPDSGMSYRPLIPAALAWLGRDAEARRECAAFREVAGHWNLDLVRLLAPEGLTERLIEGIRRAGWDVAAADGGPGGPATPRDGSTEPA